MVGSKIAVIAAGLAAWIFLSTGAQAFEQQQPAASQPAQAPPPVAASGMKALSLEKNATGPTKKDAQKGVKVPGLGTFTMPKLNFGLDLMYGEGRTDDQTLGFTNDPLVENDVTIMGKVKKRF